jgi:GNAT superfamily N-acetyltransferase
MNQVSIRLATVADAAPIALLATQLGYPADPGQMRLRLEKILGRSDHLVVVAENHEGVCGWLQACCTDVLESGFRAEIVGLVVGENARRQGVGRLLVDRAETWATAAGAGAIVVRSNVTRVESHAFYPALGYATAKTQTVYRKRLTKKTG